MYVCWGGEKDRVGVCALVALLHTHSDMAWRCMTAPPPPHPPLQDKTVILWQLAVPGHASSQAKQLALLGGHTDVVTSVAFNHEGNLLATTSFDGERGGEEGGGRGGEGTTTCCDGEGGVGRGHHML